MLCTGRVTHSFLIVAAVLFAASPCTAGPSIACFRAGAPSVYLPPSPVTRAVPASARCSRPDSTNSVLSTPLGRYDARRRCLIVAAMAPKNGTDKKQGAADKEEKENGGKRGFFGLGGGGDDSSNAPKAEGKRQRKRDIMFFRREAGNGDGTDSSEGESNSESSGGFFRRKRKRGEEKQQQNEMRNGKRGIQVDINTFVGPVLPTESEVALKAMLDSSPEKKEKLAKERKEMEEVERKRKEAQESQDAKAKAASEMARKELADRSKAEQQKKDEQKSRNAEKSDGGILSGAQSLVSGVAKSVFGERKQEEWMFVCPKTRIQPGEVVPVVAGGLDLLLVASRDGKRLACIANSCPHLGTPLETGIVERRPVEGPASRKPDVAEDGCEDCIVCPTHQTAFALASGEVRGEWCPYPPVLGQMMGAVKTKANLPTFSVRARGKNIEVRINSNLNDIKKK